MTDYQSGAPPWDAIKTGDVDLGDDGKVSAAIVCTARIERIVPVYEIGERKTGEPFLTMRPAEGQPLEDLIRSREDATGAARAAHGSLAAPDPRGTESCRSTSSMYSPAKLALAALYTFLGQ